MSRTPRVPAAFAALVCAAAAAGDDVERFALNNGLRVILQPADAAPKVALVTLFDVGEIHDPPGRSGLGHLIEHLYVTAAAGERPATTAQDWIVRYDFMANAQTGRRYTLVATVFTAALLEQELADVAARMSDLAVEPSDLERERTRMGEELASMYGGPYLSAANLAVTAALPLPGGGRKGGVMEQIAAVTSEEVRARHQALYKPCNATIVLVGGFDAAEARKMIEARCAALPRGERVADPPAVPPPAPGTARPIVTAGVSRPPVGQFPEGIAAVAYPAPSPASPAYAPFLAVVSRMYREFAPEIMQARRRHLPVEPVMFAPFDQPEVVIVSADLQAGETDQDGVARLRQRVARAATLGEGEPTGGGDLAQWLGPMLGLSEFPAALLAQNPYGPAFTMGRRAQMGMDSEAIRRGLETLTREDFARCAGEILGANRGAAVVVRLE